MLSVLILDIALVLTNGELFFIVRWQWSWKKCNNIQSYSSSVHSNNRNKDILILGKGLADGLYDTKITVEAEHTIMKATVVLLIEETSISSKQKILK